MKMLAMISFLSLAIFLGAVVQVARADIGDGYSMSQRDLSCSQQRNTHSQFSDHEPKSGAIANLAHGTIEQSQNDLSKTYATSNAYRFEDNPNGDKQQTGAIFKQSQHDKSMSEC